LIGGGAVLGLFAYLVRTNDTVREVDAAAARWGHDHATRFSDTALDLVTRLGDTWPVVVAGLVLVVVEWIRRPNRFVLPFLLAVVIGDKVATTAIKTLVDRARPTLNPIAQTLGPSFPSGHSSTAAAFFAAAALILGRDRSRRGRAALAGGAVAIAVAVACSRVLLDVHWLSDVVAGLALGWAWFTLCAIAFGGRLLRFGVTAEHITSEAHAELIGTDGRDPNV
jgi:undecaprenyl-diphosphatase